MKMKSASAQFSKKHDIHKIFLMLLIIRSVYVTTNHKQLQFGKASKN